MGRNLENKKELTLIQIMNSDDLNSKNIMIVSLFSTIGFLLIVILGNNSGMNSAPYEYPCIT
jgi:hypothetical protein